MVAQRLSNHCSSYWLSSRLIFPSDFKTNGMLLTDKSFCLFEINTWPLHPKNFTNLSRKIKRLEQCKFTCVDCKYQAGFCSEFTKITVFFFKITGRKFIAGLVKWSATCSKLSGVLVQGGLVLASKIFFPENASWLDGRIATF